MAREELLDILIRMLHLGRQGGRLMETRAPALLASDCSEGLSAPASSASLAGSTSLGYAGMQVEVMTPMVIMTMTLVWMIAPMKKKKMFLMMTVLITIISVETVLVPTLCDRITTMVRVRGEASCRRDMSSKVVGA